jgi:molecular chaperone DnaJ
MQNDAVDDPYLVLGVARTATAGEVKRAYRQLSMTWHPDHHLGEPEFQRSEAERRFKRIHAAYKAITTPGAVIAPEAPRREQDEPRAQTNPAREAQLAAVRSVVGSTAMRILPGISHHNYRRITSVVERLVQNTLSQGEDAFRSGFENALYDAMVEIGISASLRDDTVKVLDAVLDDLQWRGKGADPQTWRQLLQPLEKALRSRRRR